MKRSILKLGGSLLDWHDWPGRFRSFIAVERFQHALVIGGGGELVEQLRLNGTRSDQDDVDAHWAAVEIMSLNARRMQRLLGWELVAESTTGSICRRLDAGGLQILDAAPWLRRHPDALPQSWDTTSDSIAAMLAIELDVDELVLLKSRSSRSSSSFSEMAELGIVDRHFPSLAHRVPLVRLVNLRQESPGHRRSDTDDFPPPIDSVHPSVNKL